MPITSKQIEALEYDLCWEMQHGEGSFNAIYGRIQKLHAERKDLIGALLKQLETARERLLVAEQAAAAVPEESEDERRRSYAEAKSVVDTYQSILAGAGIDEAAWLNGDASLLGAPVAH